MVLLLLRTVGCPAPCFDLVNVRRECGAAGPRRLPRELPSVHMWRRIRLLVSVALGVLEVAVALGLLA